VSTGGTGARASHSPRRRRRRRHFKFGAGMAGGSPPRPGAAEDGPIASNTRSFFGFASASGPPAPGLVSPGQYHTSSTVMATYSPCVYIKIIVRLGCRPSARGSYRPSDLAQPHGSGLTGLAGSCQWRGPGPGQRGYKLAFEKAGAGTRFLIATWHPRILGTMPR
jgi:hypothetical protein